MISLYIIDSTTQSIQTQSRPISVTLNQLKLRDSTSMAYRKAGIEKSSSFRNTNPPSFSYFHRNKTKENLCNECYEIVPKGLSDLSVANLLEINLKTNLKTDLTSWHVAIRLLATPELSALLLFFDWRSTRHWRLWWPGIHEKVGQVAGRCACGCAS